MLLLPIILCYLSLQFHCRSEVCQFLDMSQGFFKYLMWINCVQLLGWLYHLMERVQNLLKERWSGEG